MLDVDAIAKSSGGEFDESGGMYFSRKMWGNFVGDLRDTGLPARPEPTIPGQDLPAFPCEWDYIGSNRTAANGMTLRQFFAAHAVSGVLHMVATGQHELGIVRPTGAAGIAHSAYEIADAMIKAGSE